MAPIATPSPRKWTLPADAGALATLSTLASPRRRRKPDERLRALENHTVHHEHRFNSTQALLLLSIALMTTGGCVSEFDLIAIENANNCNYSCGVDVDSTWDNDIGNADQAGVAVEIIAWGENKVETPAGGGMVTLTERSIDKRFRGIAAGAPSDGRGYVYVKRAKSKKGEMNLHDPHVLEGPFGATQEFGAALKAADIRDGRTFVQGNGLLFSPIFRPTGYGEELMVGAPGTNDDTGALYWYEGHRQAGMDWVYGNAYSADAVGGDRFGSVIAAPTPHDARHPDITESEVPNWIAVTAEGADRVYILGVDATSSQPFSIIQKINGGPGFGSALEINDFDDDGLMDLAVGAPQSGPGSTGKVSVFPGDSLGFGVDVSKGVIITGTSAFSTPGAFGTALSSGNIDPSDTGRIHLMIGDPAADEGAYTNSGGICSVSITTHTNGNFSVDDQQCWMNPRPEDRARWGAAIVVGNFSDEAGQGSCGTAEEVAVSAPKASYFNMTTGVFLFEAGKVEILSADSAGFDPELPPMETFWGEEPLERFGADIASDYVQRNRTEDLTVGAPDKTGDQGAMYLTKARDLGGAADDISGVWVTQDSDGGDFNMALTWNGDELIIKQRQNAHIVLGSSANTPCSVIGNDVETTGKLSFPDVVWPTSQVDHSEPIEMDLDIPNWGVITVGADLEYIAATHTFTLTIIEDYGALINTALGNNCPMQGNPFVLDQSTEFNCED